MHSRRRLFIFGTALGLLEEEWKRCFRFVSGYPTHGVDPGSQLAPNTLTTGRHNNINLGRYTPKLDSYTAHIHFHIA